MCCRFSGGIFVDFLMQCVVSDAKLPFVVLGRLFWQPGGGSGCMFKYCSPLVAIDLLWNICVTWLLFVPFRSLILCLKTIAAMLCISNLDLSSRSGASVFKCVSSCVTDAFQSIINTSIKPMDCISLIEEGTPIGDL